MSIAKIPKQEYTAEFKELAVKRVKSGQAVGAVAKELGLVEDPAELGQGLRRRQAECSGSPEISRPQGEGEARHNAPTESWFNSFKNERVHGVRFATRAEMKAEAFEYIEALYNRKRLHSSLGYKSPTQFL